MKHLFKLYFFDTTGKNIKRELYLTSYLIDYLTIYKKDDVSSEGTTVTTNLFMPDKTPVRHIVSGVPENANQIVFDGLFYKATIQYVAGNGAIKKYTAWLNPDNIAMMYSLLPGCTEVYFFSGACLLVSNTTGNIFQSIREHCKRYKERSNDRYGKNKKT